MKYDACATINTGYLKNNIDCFRSTYNYQYYIMDVSNNAFNHGMYLINYFNGRIHYLWVHSFQDVMLIRKYNKDIPILFNGEITKDNIYDLILNNCIFVIKSYEQLEEIISWNIKDQFSILLKIHLHNQNGIYSKHIVEEIVELLKSHVTIHILGVRASLPAKEQLELEYLMKPLPKMELMILNDEDNKEPLDQSNAIKLDASLYGVKDNHKLLKKDKSYLQQIFSLNSKIVHTAVIIKGKKEHQLAIIPYGHLHGMNDAIKKVYIKGKLYPVREIKEDCTILEIDSSIKLGDIVHITCKENPIDLYIKHNSLLHFSMLNSNLPIVYDDYVLEKTFIY